VGPQVALPFRGVVGGSRQVGFRQNVTGASLIEQLPQIGPTPPAAGPCPETLAQLPHAAGLRDAEEIDHLSLRHVKAKAQVIVQVHGKTPSKRKLPPNRELVHTPSSGPQCRPRLPRRAARQSSWIAATRSDRLDVPLTVATSRIVRCSVGPCQMGPREYLARITKRGLVEYRPARGHLDRRPDYETMPLEHVKQRR